MSIDPPLIKLRSIGVRIGAANILRELDLTVLSGEGVGIYGDNGSGKTTLLRTVATLLRPSSGRGMVLGADLASAERFKVRTRIGFIGHIPALYPELTLEENLKFITRVTGKSSSSIPVALETVGLSSASSRRVDECSYGMQRRAEFAREILRSPDLLLLDEPHTALDASAIEIVEYLVGQVTESGGAVLIVSHDRDRVAPMLSRVSELKAGMLS